MAVRSIGAKRMHEPMPDTREEMSLNAETELKLCCAPGVLDQIADAPMVAGYARDGGTTEELTAIYYDTPDLDLLETGSVLRVRNAGAGFTMTLKRPNDDAGWKGLVRDEWEVPVAGMEPDLAPLLQCVPETSLELLRAKPLRPWFRTEVQRRLRRLDTPLGQVELALDRGRIVAGERSEEISEVELELLDGTPETVFQLAQELAAEFPLCPAVGSKSGRGYELALGRPPEIGKAPPLRYPADATLSEALDACFRTASRHLLENQAAAADGREPEGLHQYRVALRRLRSLLRLARPFAAAESLDPLRQEAKWLMSSLDAARDWDVFATETLREAMRACTASAGGKEVAAAAEAHQRAAQEGVRAAIADPRTGRFQIALALWIERRGWRADAPADAIARLDGPARKFATKALDRLHRKVLKRGRGFACLPAEGRHRVRLALKELRYAVDFFQPLIDEGKASRRYAKRLAQLQDALGRYNDLSRIQALVGQIADAELSGAGNRAAGELLGWHLALRDRDDEALVAAWKRFCKLEPCTV